MALASPSSSLAWGSRTRKGSRWLNAALKDAAMAAIRTNNSYLRALYERQRSRIGHVKAIGAVKHTMLVAAWHMLTNGELYNDLGPDYYRQRDPTRTTKRLVAQLERLGHTVTLQQAAA
jgi:transposase